MASTLCQKSVKKKKKKKQFWSKISKFQHVVWTILFCSNFSSTWNKHLLRNVWRDFRVPWTHPRTTFRPRILRCINFDIGESSPNLFLNIVNRLKICGATRNPEFPRTGPDRTETGPGSGNILKNIFESGRVGEFYFGSVRVGEFYFGWVRVGVFFTGVWDVFSWDFGDKLAFHFQTEEVEWLLSLISTLFDVITLLKCIFTCLL